MFCCHIIVIDVVIINLVVSSCSAVVIDVI